MINQERLLIISNNVLSMTRNNGKTILSCIDSLPKDRVRQLYFSEEKPLIDGYRYYQISDSDIVKARISGGKPGKAINSLGKVSSDMDSVNGNGVNKKSIKRNSVTLMLRNAIWKNKWKTKALADWLDDFEPTVIFFVAGDCLFAYDICEYIRERYQARLCLYVTDDYIMPRSDDTIVDKSYRKKIKKTLNVILGKTDVFFTISEMMQEEYKYVFNKDSIIIANMTDSLKMEGNENKSDESPIVFTYAGSLYYGRDTVLDRIGEVLKELNEKNSRINGILNIYSNNNLSGVNINENSGCKLCGSLNPDELKLVLNQSDVLVFVESSDKKFIEKTRYSFSTKIPEYLSVGKLILAVGPTEISSMMYLKDCALCVNSFGELEQAINNILLSNEMREEYGKKAIRKFKQKHSKVEMQQVFLKHVMQYKTGQEQIL